MRAYILHGAVWCGAGRGPKYRSLRCGAGPHIGWWCGAGAGLFTAGRCGRGPNFRPAQGSKSCAHHTHPWERIKDQSRELPACHIIMGKLMESLVRDKLVSRMMDNQLFCDAQHGFVPGHSCMTQLLITIVLWSEMLDAGDPIDVIYYISGKRLTRCLASDFWENLRRTA